MTDAPAANQKAADRLADIREQMRRRIERANAALRAHVPMVDLEII
jgi:hypothetical protein